MAWQGLARLGEAWQSGARHGIKHNEKTMKKKNKKAEPYLRKKNDQWVIEKKVDGCTHYLITLPPINQLLEILKNIKEVDGKTL